jgi:long-chain acyl-CoA synthetase
VSIDPASTLGAALDESAARWGDELAVRSGGRDYRYAELHRLSKQVQTRLAQQGVVRGDRVAWMLPNGMEAAVICFGTLGIGGISVPISPLMREREIGHYLADSGATVCFAAPDRCEQVAGLTAELGVTMIPVTDEFLTACAELPAAPSTESVAPDDAAYVIYTSGTTGQPKGVVLSHANLTSNIAVAAKLNEASRGDVIYGGLPLTHIFGQSCALHSAVRTGAAVTLDARFDAKALLDSICRNEVTIVVGVPSMFVSLIEQMDATGMDRLDSALKVVISGGAALPLDVLESIESRLGVVILESYGLTEATGYVLSERREHVEADRRTATRAAGSVGTPVDGCEVRIVGETGVPVGAGERGELQVRGRIIMRGYWNDPDATKAAFDGDWLKTGDLSYRDEAGRFFIIGRKKDLIVRGGHNVHPREIEEVMHGHPLVREVAVLGVPDPRLGEEVVAAVALRGVTGEPEERQAIEALLAYAKQNLAAYKYPRRVKVFPDLPKGANGKILKPAIPEF